MTDERPTETIIVRCTQYGSALDPKPIIGPDEEGPSIARRTRPVEKDAHPRLFDPAVKHGTVGTERWVEFVVVRGYADEKRGTFFLSGALTQAYRVGWLYALTLTPEPREVASTDGESR